MLPVNLDPIVDEEWYLARYPDVALAINQNAQKGEIVSARVHYLRHGQREGREAYRFDAAWYRRAYPLVDRDIAQGRAASLKEHYERCGRYRGYLPHAQAVRPAKQRASSDILWIDFPNARDIVAGRLDAGLISSHLAVLLAKFIDDGFVVLQDTIRQSVVDHARHDLAKAYIGCYEALRFDCATLAPTFIPWQPAINDGTAAALNIHSLSPSIRNLIFSEQVVSFLQLLFDSRPIVYATEGYLRGSGRSYGKGEARAPTTMRQHMAGAWFALEDEQVGMSEFCCWPGSHRLANDLVNNPPVRSAELGQTGASQPNISRRFLELGLREQTLALGRGDAVIWHADLWHGEKPTSHKIMHRSVEALYCPNYVAPISWESRPVRLVEHDGQGFYTIDAQATIE
jgi:hypothetical protein